MKHKLVFTLALVIGLGTTIALARPAARTPLAPVAPTSIPFDAFSMTLEINATAIDAGILYFSDTSEGLEQVFLKDPSGQTIFQMAGTDQQGLGITELFWETAEPDITTALLAYPAGRYHLLGLTPDGTLLESTTVLSHETLAAPVITAPADGEQLPVDNVVLKWVFDPEAAYFMEFEADELDIKYTLQLPEGISEFQIPASLLQPDAEYKIGLMAFGENGNATVTEIGFATLP